MITATRHATLQDMVEVLKDQRARRHDLVVSADRLRFEEGQLVLRGFEPMMDDDGFTPVDGIYRPTEIFDEHISDRLSIPIRLIKQLRLGADKIKARPDLYDALVNGYLKGRKGKLRLATQEERNSEHVTKELGTDGVARIWDRDPIQGDPRRFLLRLFVSDDGTQNVARALLSNRFAVMDNLDALMAMLSGITAAGIDPTMLKISGDLSERKMYINVHAPEIFTLAPELLDGYRSPFDDPGVDAQRAQFQRRLEMGAAWNEGGRAALEAAGGSDGSHVGVTRGNEPIIHAGFTLANSEVGQGKYNITPSVVVLACTNGQTVTKDAMERTHLGAALSEGAVEWSSKTMQANLELVSSMTADAVSKFLSVGYVQSTVDWLTKKSGAPVSRNLIEAVLKHKTIAFDDTAIAGILDHFIMGGQRTSGGLMQAITSYSQTVDSADEAHDMDGKAIAAMELAYASS